MKIRLDFLIFFYFFFYLKIFSQDSPKVPDKIRIDNIILEISDDIKPTIQNEVDALHLNKKYFQVFIDRINIFFPIIERILQEEELPEDFKYLALQESALISDAVSSSNAVGFWQFKKETAEDYGLIINNNIDERKNIVSSTSAASKYIKNSNFIFENWIFSILSYYHGLSGAKELVDPKLYGSKRMQINNETHWYIIKFIGYKIAFENFIDKKNYNSNYSIYDNRSFDSLEDLSKSLSIEKEDLLSLNSWINSDKIPRNKVYSFLIPDTKENIFIKSEFSRNGNLSQNNSQKSLSKVDEKVLKVLSNRSLLLNGLPAIILDSLRNIEDYLKDFNLSKKSFYAFNDIKSNQELIPGIPYYLTRKRKRGRVQVYTRREDETLWEISQLFGIQLSSLKKINKNNNSDKIVLRKRSIL